MNDNHLLQYPPSYSYGEILNTIKNKRDFAYCYTGDKAGTLMFVDDFGELKKLSTNGVFNNYEDSRLNNFELWTFLSDMEESSIFKQTATNVMFYLYCDLYNYLDSLGLKLF